MSIFEAGMLICFGFAWPVNIYKSYKSRTAKGKSVFFLLIIILGYVFGIINKLLYNRDIVLILYVLNMLMVSVDVCFYFRNQKLDKQQDAQAACECKTEE
ncbi:MAG: hypothetical protein VB085_08395 [Peptococcaceae bacterium]|nr:hypothetical protein [Peptococcaceae bacterium]